MYALIALGFSLVYNSSRIFHIAYAGLLVISPYSFIFFRNKLGLNYSISLGLSVTITAIFSVLIYKIVYRNLFSNHRSEATMLLSSIGIFTVIVNLISALMGNQLMGMGNTIHASAWFGKLLVTNTQITQAIFCISTFIVLFYLLNKTKYGIVIRAISDDDTLCTTLRINIDKVRMVIFIISGLIAAISGLIYANSNGVEPFSGMPLLLTAITVLIIGGIRDYASPILGGIIIGVLQAAISGYLSSEWQNAIIYMILIMFLIFRPNGLLSLKERLV
jgi:branched-chain amino acid transport system permease protein